MTEPTTKRKRQPYSAANSLNDPSSNLAKLVDYVRMCEQQGKKATRLGFARFVDANKITNYGKEIIRVAKARKFLINGDRIKEGFTLKLGPNANEVASMFEQPKTKG